MLKNPYYCSNCKYLTTDKKNWSRHLNTIKHIKNTTSDDNVVVKRKKRDKNNVVKKKEEKKYICDLCGKTYKFKSGLSRHRQKCMVDAINTNIRDDDNQTPNEEIKVEKEVNSINNKSDRVDNLERLLEKTIANQNDTINKLLPNIGNNVTNNTTNNTTHNHTTNNVTNYNNMTINLFLNDKCNNAMNLTEFMNRIQLSYDDVEYTKSHGYIKGIANIFYKNLEGIKKTERPIHCSDNNNLSFYVRDENKWENDKENVKIDRSIESLTRKQIEKLKEWEGGNPRWSQSEKKTEIFMKTVRSLMLGIDDDEKENTFELIKRELGGNINIDELINKEKQTV